MCTGNGKQSSLSADPRLLGMKIGGVRFKPLVDSGSSANTITPLVWKEIKEKSPVSLFDVMYEPQDKLTGYGNFKTLEVMCSFTANIEVIGGRKASCRAKFFVINGVEMSLLSYETACELGVLRIGLPESEESFELMQVGPGEANGSGLPEVEAVKEFPKIPMEPAKIRIKEEVPVRQIIRYNIPKAFEKQANERLRQMQIRGIIERADRVGDVISSVSPMVLVPKKGDDFRIVIDYREVNKRIVREPYPLPQLEKIWTEIPATGSNERLLFTVLDLSDAFFHIELDESIRHITTFMTASGLRRFTRLPFGLSCAPELFQKTMEIVLIRCKGILVYLDDILIYGKSAEELKSRTEIVKETLRANNLTINEKKSKYGLETIEFLGFKIDGKGIKPSDKKISDIKSFRRPKSFTQLRSFLGLITFISPFIKDFSHKTHQLRRLLKEKEFVWDAVHNEAFENLKVEAEKHVIERGYFKDEDPIVLFTDASPWGLGAVLVQTDDLGKDRIIACASKSLTETEARYPQLHREALAIVWAMERFSYYLLGRRFKLKSDSKALMFMTQYKKLKADNGKRILTRAEGWFLRLEHYNFEFEFVEGKSNIADAPSRIACVKKELEFGAGQEDFEVCLVRPQEVYELCLVRPEPEENCAKYLGVKAGLIKSKTRADEEIQKVIGWLRGENKDAMEGLERYFAVKKALYLNPDGILMKEGKVVLPSSLREQVLKHAHKGHQDAPGMKFSIRQAAFWFGMNKDVINKILSCEVCSKTTAVNAADSRASLELNIVAMTNDQVKVSQEADDEMKLITGCLGEKVELWPMEIKKYQPFAKEMHVANGVLKKENKSILPLELRSEALKIAHTAHPGMSMMKRVLRQGLWWPGMDRDAEEFVRSCPHCQLIVDSCRPQPIVLTKLPNNPWEYISMDFSTASVKENWKALVITDHYSRFLVAIPMTKTDAETTKVALARVFQTYYLPKAVRADNGPPFNSSELKNWFKELGVVYENSTPLNPTENGLVERQM